MSDPKTTTYHLEVIVASGPNEVLTGTFETGPISKADGLDAISNMAQIAMAVGGADFGQNARPAAANLWMRNGLNPKVLVASSPWMDELDWSRNPASGQPKGGSAESV